MSGAGQGPTGAEPAVPPTGPVGGADWDDDSAGLTGLLGQWATAIGPMFFGLQVGSVVGHLSQRALGQYPLALPWTPSDELLIVPGQHRRLRQRLEPARRGGPALGVRPRAGLQLRAHPAGGADSHARPAHRPGRLDRLGPADLAGRLCGMLGQGGRGAGEGTDLESLQGMFGRPRGAARRAADPRDPPDVGPAHRPGRGRRRLCRPHRRVVGGKLVGSHAQLAEAWYRRRIERGKGEEAAGALFGLDLERDQVDRGRAFVAGVVERAGEEGLARLWTSARELPTPAEVDAPGLWLERIALPELEEGTDSTDGSDGSGSAADSGA